MSETTVLQEIHTVDADRALSDNSSRHAILFRLNVGIIYFY
jgi:hypothetical protein